MATMQESSNVFFLLIQVINYSLRIFLDGWGKNIDLEGLAHGLEEYLAEGPHIEPYHAWGWV